MALFFGLQHIRNIIFFVKNSPVSLKFKRVERGVKYLKKKENFRVICLNL